MAATTWFKLFSRFRVFLDALSDEQAGRVIKAALAYLESGEVRPLDPAETLLFLGLKEDIDEGIARYQERCEKNRQNVRKRWDR